MVHGPIGVQDNLSGVERCESAGTFAYVFFAVNGDVGAFGVRFDMDVATVVARLRGGNLFALQGSDKMTQLVVAECISHGTDCRQIYLCRDGLCGGVVKDVV